MPAQGSQRVARPAGFRRGALSFFGGAPMKLVVNGEGYETRGAGSVEALVEEMGIPARTVVVALNGEVLPAALRGTQPLREGDRVELFRFVGGG
jgi:sulfur carrier protein